MDDDKDKGLLLYAPNGRSGRPCTDLYISGLSRSFYLDNYVESLILFIKSGTLSLNKRSDLIESEIE